MNLYNCTAKILKGGDGSVVTVVVNAKDETTAREFLVSLVENLRVGATIESMTAESIPSEIPL